MARKLDRDDATQHPQRLDLPYRDDVTASLVRVLAQWSSGDYQREIARGAGIPDDERAIRLIYALAARGPQRPSALAGLLDTSPAATSRLLESLAAAGLAHRTPDPLDARATLVVLTDAGRASARNLFSAGDALMRRLLADWTEADRERFAALLHRFADAVEARPDTHGGTP
ncbi:MarR family winged helix-turn-helix transcriptional regulator [Protaetiibacter intestinalis]|uniref:MarR family transcriptional regulator n=1 Tax=Protaetiibacter intestinalis TaxID=2419774 RepID=A0A387B8K8_9MICO|nr:MarR family winged helix-turn-helix transcriptional regulator [Protaetiibacter intestinalis]AYF97426.1 MarR family transcriptional regulator [Protaetiibacter intestinalis]